MNNKYRVACIAFVIVLFASLKADGCNKFTNGTTPDLQDIFIGRCEEHLQHLQCLQDEHCYDRPDLVNCTAVWETFLSAFKSKDPCATPKDAYDAVLKMAPPITPVDQTLFWSSGILGPALNVARVSQHYRILEETLPGYIANNLIWCGDPGPESTDGINSERCPDSRQCNKCNSSFTFWQTASREFAKQARGKVYVALDAHGSGGAFRNGSTFGMIELPHLSPDNVTMVEILLVPNITKPESEAGEKCGEGSIKELERRLDEAGLKWTCNPNPVEFLFIQCTTLEDPQAYKACQDEEDDDQDAVIVGSVLGVVLAGCLVVGGVVVLLLRKRNEDQNLP